MAQVCKKSQSKEIQENQYSTFLEYLLPFKNLSVGISKINGTHPEKGFDSDEQLEQVWYVQDGSATIHFETTKEYIQSGDMILISPKEKYRIEGNVTLLVCSSPPWTIEQHKHFER